ncbi:15941_t:CDS:1, partial [Racocetra persica]
SDFSFYGVISALESQVMSLQELKLKGRYIPEFIVLNNCETLKTLRIRDKDALPLVKQLADGLCKICTLDIETKTLNTSDIIPLLRKAGPHLECLSLLPSNE